MSDGKLKPTYRAVEQLVPYDRNARTHSPVQVQQIADSIEAFGMAGAIVVREGMIAKGHGTLAACSLLYGQGKRIYPPPGPSAPEDQRPEAFPAGKVPVLEATGQTFAQVAAERQKPAAKAPAPAEPAKAPSKPAARRKAA